MEGARFNILLGTDPEDVKRWREQRRARWPSRARLARDAEANAPPAGLAALAAYDSEDSDEPPPQKKHRPEKVCLSMLHGGRCRRGAARAPLVRAVLFNGSSRRAQRAVVGYFLPGRAERAVLFFCLFSLFLSFISSSIFHSHFFCDFLQ